MIQSGDFFGEQEQVHTESLVSRSIIMMQNPGVACPVVSLEAEVQLALLNQAGQESMAVMIKTPGLPDFVD